jgi:hypothetical protein
MPATKTQEPTLTTADIDAKLADAETERARLEDRQRAISQEIGANYGTHDTALEIEFGQILARLNGLAEYVKNKSAERAQLAGVETLQAYREATGAVHGVYGQMHSIDQEIKAHQQIIEDLTQQRSKLEFEALQAAQSQRRKAQQAAVEAGNSNEALGTVNKEFPPVGLYY